MGAGFRSIDGGKRWQIIPQFQAHAFTSEASYPNHVWSFHPTDPNLIFVGSLFGFYRSSDQGETWQQIPGRWDVPAQPGWPMINNGPRLIRFDPSRPDIGICAIKVQGNFNDY